MTYWKKENYWYPFPCTLYKDFNRKLKQRCLSNACLLYYGPFPLSGSGFDKCFLPVDSILVTDTKILYSNFSLVKSSHIIRKKPHFWPALQCMVVHSLSMYFKNIFFYFHFLLFLPMLYYSPKQIAVFLLQFLQCMHHFHRHLLSIMPPLADLSKSGSFASLN